MPFTCLHDRAALEATLRRDVYLHLYALGDLDPAYWPRTTWYGHGDAVALVYTATTPPTLLALTPPPFDDLRVLLRSLWPVLPPRLYAHLTPECADALAPRFRVASHGRHHKMRLADPSKLAIDTAGVEALSSANADELTAFYTASYSHGWFDPRMLASGWFRGVRDGAELVSVAGVHVHSMAYRVAAVGSIATHPSARNRGLAAKVTAALCRELLPTVEHLGLNVKADNAPAVACYERLGFVRHTDYEECTVSLA